MLELQLSPSRKLERSESVIDDGRWVYDNGAYMGSENSDSIASDATYDVAEPRVTLQFDRQLYPDIRSSSTTDMIDPKMFSPANNDLEVDLDSYVSSPSNGTFTKASALRQYLCFPYHLIAYRHLILGPNPQSGQDSIQTNTLRSKGGSGKLTIPPPPLVPPPSKFNTIKRPHAASEPLEMTPTLESLISLKPSEPQYSTLRKMSIGSSVDLPVSGLVSFDSVVLRNKVKRPSAFTVTVPRRDNSREYLFSVALL